MSIQCQSQGLTQKAHCTVISYIRKITLHEENKRELTRYLRDYLKKIGNWLEIHVMKHDRPIKYRLVVKMIRGEMCHFL